MIVPTPGVQRAHRSVTWRKGVAALETVRTIGPRVALRRGRQDGRLARLGRDRIRDETYQEIWTSGANAVGADVEPLGGGNLRIDRDGSSTVVRRQHVGLDDPAALRLASDKERAHRLMREAGVEVPEQHAFGVADRGAGEGFVARHQPCVVKPAGATGGGAGVTGGVRTRDDLRRAVRKVGRWGERALVERQASGLVYRLLLLDHEPLDVVERRPPEVTGDGRSTVAQLMEQENERRLRARQLVGSLLRPDLDTALALRAQGLTMKSIPPAGTTVVVKSLTSQNAQSENATWRGELADDVLGTARRAALALGLRLAGVDIVSPDPLRPLADNDGVLIEVNGNPGLQHHYLVADPEAATPVAIPILERLLDESR